VHPKDPTPDDEPLAGTDMNCKAPIYYRVDGNACVVYRISVNETKAHLSGHQPLRAVLIVFALLTSFACGVAWSYDRDKTDVVMLRNGDRISGDIISLEHGILTLKTDNVGTIYIEWPAVRAVASKFAFAVERMGGVNSYGVIKTTEDGTALVVGTEEHATTIPLAELERISQYSPSFWNRISGNLAVGFSYTKSSEISVGSVNLDAHYRSTAVDSSVTFSSNTTRGGSGGETDRDVLAGTVMFLQQSRNFWALVGSLERDQALGIDARVVGGAALGRRLQQSAHSEITGMVGLVGTKEWVTGDAPPRSSLEGLIGADWRIFRFIDPKTTLDLSVAFFPSLTDSGRYRGLGNLSFTHKITGDLTLGLSGYFSSDSRPPEGATEKSDYGVTFNLGYSFGQ
jgi:hypothetical protein